jgi:hypothetical protein
MRLRQAEREPGGGAATGLWVRDNPSDGRSLGSDAFVWTRARRALRAARAHEAGSARAADGHALLVFGALGALADPVAEPGLAVRRLAEARLAGGGGAVDVRRAHLAEAVGVAAPADVGVVGAAPLPALLARADAGAALPAPPAEPPDVHATERVALDLLAIACSPVAPW